MSKPRSELGSEEVSGPSAETQLRILKIVGRLDTAELAATYQRYAGNESQGLSREQMAATPTRELTLTSVQHSSMLQYTSVSVTDECKKKPPGECYAH